MKTRKCLLAVGIALFASVSLGSAKLMVTVSSSDTIGSKSILRLQMKNGFSQGIQSARATVFLLDEEGKVVGHASNWIIGGTKDRPALDPEATGTYNFVISNDKAFSTSNIFVTRVILEGGKVIEGASGFELEK